MGSGQTAVAAVRTHRHYVGVDSEEQYVDLARRGMSDDMGPRAANHCASRSIR
jgi:hypothetical protein